jgi:DNA polymerase-1
VDNVPGVPGIGPKGAAELLAAHDTLEGVLAHVDDVPGAKRRESLRQHAETARAGRELIRLATDVPLDIPWEAARCRPPDPAALAEFLREMGFKSLLARVVRDIPRAAPRPAAAPPPSRGVPRTLFDALEAADAAALLAAEPAAGITQPAAGITEPAAEISQPADEPARAALVARLATGPVAVCCGRAPGGSGGPGRTLAPPVGIAVVGGGVTAWIDAAVVAGSPAVRGLLADAGIPKHGHDLKREWLALAALGVDLGGLACDTMLAAYLLEAGERNLGLSEVAVRYGVAVEEAGRVLPAAALDDPADMAAAVAACRTAARLAAILPARLDEEGLARLFGDVEMPLAAVLAGMERRGVRIDAGLLATLSADYAAKLAALEAEIHALAGHPFLIGSPLQVRSVLFDELGLPVVKRTKTGPSTDAEVLEQLSTQHPLPARLLDHRRYAKLKSTYVDALPALVNPATGRIHTSFNQTATATGRLSSSDPNLQNIPVRSVEGQQIRAAFLPREPGWRFVSADYSQIELRVLAHLSGDEAMRRAFAAGEDIHTSTAAAVFGIDAAAVSAPLRRTAKAVNFGILYGQSGFGLAKALGIPQAEAAAFIAAYFRTFAGAAAFIDEVLDRCRRDGHVTTMLGRRRAITGVRDRAGRRSAAGGFALSLPERTAVNTVVQGSAADLIKLAMLGVSRRLAAAGSGAGLVLQIHDELLLESPAAETGAVRELVVEEMLRAMPLEVPLEVSVHEGATWAECEK